MKDKTLGLTITINPVTYTAIAGKDCSVFMPKTPDRSHFL